MTIISTYADTMLIVKAKSFQALSVLFTTRAKIIEFKCAIVCVYIYEKQSKRGRKKLRTNRSTSSSEC